MLYADDTNVSFASAEISTLFQVVTEDLKLISEWLKHNRLYYLIYLKQMLSSFQMVHFQLNKLCFLGLFLMIF
jgi:hypothetical protein